MDEGEEHKAVWEGTVGMDSLLGARTNLKPSLP